uniref:Peptidyl-glycine alpha-amidating monooxygenase-like n=1 Tax=Saccoglossus kowalevskii TaxID=10224 RepID=A0ABM0MQI9_SACKO|nr:PREDICTED: peptidyl-glycine alpha-amidating monooxygenase-like [Saccoglossus kowalevskii]
MAVVHIITVLVLCLTCMLCEPYYDRQHRVDISRETDIFSIDFLMPEVSPKQTDTYLCTSVKMPEEEIYIVHYEPQADMNTVHHMILYGCEAPYAALENWECESRICRGGTKIMYAWARNAPALKLPEGVGFRVGGAGHSKYLILQVHYNNVDDFVAGGMDTSGVKLFMTYTPQRFIAGIYLLVSMDVNINPGEENVHSDVYCPYEERHRIHAFAFRVHTHNHGRVVSGYRVRNGRWSLLGKANPLWPQAFYPMDSDFEIQRNDALAARCTFSGENLDHSVNVGSTSKDEMCNFYIMYYMDNENEDIIQACSKKAIHVQFPPDSDIPPPPNEFLQDKMEYHHHENYYNYYDDYYDEDQNVEKSDDKPDDVIKAEEKENKQEEDKEDEEININHNEQTDEKVQTTSTPLKTAEVQNNNNKQGGFQEVQDWLTLSDMTLGQVSAVDLDKNGDVVIFHRKDRIWDATTFDANNNFQFAADGPIIGNTVITIDKKTGKIKHQWGSNLFYLPHGLTLDNDDNIWITDVALHQVFKFPPGGNNSPLIELGTKLEPGNDDHHFCKPADVAIDPYTGYFFVADGYCNTRIIKYSPQGEKILQWGEPSTHSIKSFPPPGTFNLPHSLVYIDDTNQVCVADRKNGRIQCFKSSNGDFVIEYHPAEFDGRVFAIDYTPMNGGLLYAINGPVMKSGSKEPLGIVIKLDTDVNITVNNKDQIKIDKGDLPKPLYNNYHDTGKDMMPTLLIMTLLAIPIVLMALVTVVLRLRAQGKLRVQNIKYFFSNGYRSTSHGNVNLGSFFNRHKGFSKVSTEDSDHDHFSEESDVDEYTAMNVGKSQNL